jgi:DNA replication protein DnaC
MTAMDKMTIPTPPEFDETPPDCAACKDSGWLEVDAENGYTRTAPCDCQKIAAHDGLMQAFIASVPPRYRDCNLDEFIRIAPSQQQALTQVWRNFLLAEGTTTLFLHGGAGTGKTHLAVGVIRALLEHNPRRALFLPVASHIETIRLTFRSKEDGETGPSIDHHPNVDILLLDDMSAARSTDWAREWVYRIIGWRYDNNLMTIITSNFNIEETSRVFGAAIASRLASGAAVFTGTEDMRMKK